MENKLAFSKGKLIIDEISQVFRYIDPIERYPMRNNGRRHHGILLALEGCEEYRMRDVTLRTAPGDVFYLPKMETYQVLMSDPVCAVLSIDFESAAFVGIPTFSLRPNNLRTLKQCFLDIEHCWQMKQAGWEMECLSKAYHIVAEMQRQTIAKYCPSEKLLRLQPGMDYLHQHFDDPNLKVETLATQCDFHPRYFAKMFRDAYGISPKQYLTQLRMERARELILSNRYTVSQVAQMTGYGDIYHFSKIFKQSNGVSPTIYRLK